MRLMRKTILFLTGGCGYVGVEYLWRGWSHGSMFLAGGSCFLLLGAASKRLRHRSPVVRAIAGSTIITAVELAAGLIANRHYTVWDYRTMPGNFMGQICIPYSLLWMPLSLGGMYLHGKLDRLLAK